MKKKILSIIVPSYNMERYLPKCLGSLLVAPELLERLEVLVVNDGSKDRTSEIAHEFEKKYPGVFCVIDKPNGNYGSCINAALQRAQGRFVKVLDADDSFETTNIPQYVDFLTATDESTDAVLTPFVYVDEADQVSKEIVYRVPVGRPFRFEDADVDRTNFVWMHGVTYRTGLLREMGYRQTEGVSYTDNEWVFGPMVRARNFLYCPHVVYRYLFGRAGQTMDDSVRVKSVGMIATVVASLAKTYGSLKGQIDGIRRLYLQGLFFEVCRTVYLTCVINFPSAERDQIVAKMEDSIRLNSQELFSLVGGSFAVGPFRYVRLWRHRRSSAALSLRVVRLLYRVRCSFRKMGV